MVRFVLDLQEVDQAQVAAVGGKGARLGELMRIKGIRVPSGFCVTTEAFRRVLTDVPAVDGMLDRLAHLDPEDRDGIRTLSAETRAAIAGAAVPDDLAALIVRAHARLGGEGGYAVRSSATTEDLATASFAGQQDTYLNVVGPEAILEHVSRCWASLFTERAVIYRLRHGFGHREAELAVVVQRMVPADAAGVLFTADPVTSDRTTASIEATCGLGDDLVSGRVNADAFTVRDGAIVERSVADKQPALTDVQVVQLARLGRQIEAHFGCPQDIEWCLADGDLHVVQSRPITTLFPIPPAEDGGTHVYISVGHQQMMTDAMKPLGLSIWQLTTPRPMAEAGGRLFVDVTQILASPESRAGLLAMAGRSDPLIGDALQTVLERDGFIESAPDDGPAWAPPGSGAGAPIETDPAIVVDLIERSDASLASLKCGIRTVSGPDLLDFIAADIQELKTITSEARSLQAIMAGMDATWWLSEHLQEWLGERDAADTLTQSVPHNVTAEMGLALLDVADVIRPHQEVVDFLDDVLDEDFLDEMSHLPGGSEARDAILVFLDTYGMRCVGEIDITRPRWSERPSALVPLILSNVKNFDPEAAKRRFEKGLQEARAKEGDVLERLRGLAGGGQKVEETKRMIDRARTFNGYREYPKYAMISRYAIYKQALLDEAERLVQVGALGEREDAFFLRFDELREALRANGVDDDLIRSRKDAFRSYEALTPPRVFTSVGEAVAGAYRREGVPTGALVGLTVSAGIVEGRARVIDDVADADLEPGDILVTAHTDPSWSPLFVAIAGLVTEVGGLMTHGAVIAREYGLPAVVGVEHATQRIQDGQQIRVNGTDGYVEILPGPARRGPDGRG